MVKSHYRLRLVFVEVEDVWQLTAGELETIKKQAAELLKPLEKTSYFSQGTVLKSQIDVNLDKILLTQSKAITPENRIRAYREARLELNGINTNIQRLAGPGRPSFRDRLHLRLRRRGPNRRRLGNSARGYCQLCLFDYIYAPVKIPPGKSSGRPKTPGYSLVQSGINSGRDPGHGDYYRHDYPANLKT